MYAVGGWEGTARLDTVERYNPITNKWYFVAPMKMAVTSPAVVAHDGSLYVTGRPSKIYRIIDASVLFIDDYIHICDILYCVLIGMYSKVSCVFFQVEQC